MTKHRYIASIWNIREHVVFQPCPTDGNTVEGGMAKEEANRLCIHLGGEDSKARLFKLKVEIGKVGGVATDTMAYYSDWLRMGCFD